MRSNPVDPSRSRIDSTGVPTTGRTERGRGGKAAEGFRELLDSQFKVTSHARNRMGREGVRMDASQERRIQSAVDRVSERGGKKSLVMLDDLALIVNVEKRTLITVITGERRGDGVFTDIDSAVIAD